MRRTSTGCCWTASRPQISCCPPLAGRQQQDASAQEQRIPRLALTYYTPAQAAARLGMRAKQLDQLVKRGKLTRQVVPPNTHRAHYLRDEVDALAAQGEPLAHASLEAAYAALTAQGEQVS